MCKFPEPFLWSFLYKFQEKLLKMPEKTRILWEMTENLGEKCSQCSSENFYEKSCDKILPKVSINFWKSTWQIYWIYWENYWRNFWNESTDIWIQFPGGIRNEIRGMHGNPITKFLEKISMKFKEINEANIWWGPQEISEAIPLFYCWKFQNMTLYKLRHGAKQIWWHFCRIIG